MRRVTGLFLAIALLAVSAMGIASSVSAQDATPTADQAGFPVNIKFLNAMTAMDTVDVYINGYDKDERVVEGLAYGTFSDTYEGTSPATQITVKNNVNLGFDQYLFDTVIASEAGQSYIVVISDFLVIPIQVNTNAIPVGGDIVDPARARLVHASSQSPAVDVLLNDEIVLRNIRYGQAGEGGVLAAASYTVSLNQTGTSNAVISQDITLENGTAAVYVVIGTPGSTDTPLTIVSDALPLNES